MHGRTVAASRGRSGYSAGTEPAGLRGVFPGADLVPETRHGAAAQQRPVYIPAFSQEVHYECELVVRIDRVGKSIAERFAHRYYKEVGLGIDFTARDLQRQAAAEGLPWERSKAFDRSAAISPEFVSLQELDGDVQKLHFTLEVNGQTRQTGDTRQMLFTVDRIIAAVSRYMTLRMGDLIYTGTPAGVGPVSPGDNLRAVLEGRELLNFDIR